MARLTKTVEISLDKVRHLKFDSDAFRVMEEVLGTLGPDTLSSFKGVRAMLWAGLLHEDRNLTLEQVGDFLGSYDRAYIVGRITAAADTGIGEASAILPSA